MTHAAAQPQTEANAKDPSSTLYVDLDGTLCVTDTLWESIARLAKTRFSEFLKTPLWLSKGKAGFKEAISDKVLPDIESLPLRPEVLELIEKKKAAGYKIVLATAADRRIAEAVAEHVGLFDEVLATDGQLNLAGSNKLAAIQSRTIDGKFEYAGDSKADLPLFEVCKKGYLAGAKASIWSHMQGFADSEDRFEKLPSKKGGLYHKIKALRPHQWAKNALLAVPLFTSFNYTDFDLILNVVFAIMSFSLVASSVYIVNDILDLPADRVHVSKCRRPFASGMVSIPTGLLMAVALVLGGFFVSYFMVGLEFFKVLLMYFGMTTLYSTYFKSKIIVDVLVLAGLYSMRIFAGGVAIGVEISEWLIAFSVFNFLSLAMIKRYSELNVLNEAKQRVTKGRRYTTEDMGLFRSFGTNAAYSSVLVFALFVSSPEVNLSYTHPRYLWLVCPVLLYWFSRTWFLTNRTRGKKVLEDPVVFALTDKASLLCGLSLGVLFFLAR